MNIEHGELKIDGKIMKSDKQSVFTILIMIISVVIYITNVVQMIVAISNEQWGLAVIKAIGVFAVLGSFITVWFFFNKNM